MLLISERTFACVHVQVTTETKTASLLCHEYIRLQLSASGDEKPDGWRNFFTAVRQMEKDQQQGVIVQELSTPFPLGESAWQALNGDYQIQVEIAPTAFLKLHHSPKDASKKERWGFLLCMHGTQLFSMLYVDRSSAG